jgi:putative phosphoribosyl transferase
VTEVVIVALVHVGQRLGSARTLFAARSDAGRQLAGFIAPAPDADSLVFALPRGGFPVARPVADTLGTAVLPALVRKLPVPMSPEMGFGAVTVDGTVVLNEPVVRAYVPAGQVDEISREVRLEVERRAHVYPGGWPLPEIEGRHVWLIDDGLATGFSVIAAARMLRGRHPARLNLGVPVSPADTLTAVSEEFDETWCLAVQDGLSFAVASFYRDFHQMTDAEVLEQLGGSGPRGGSVPPPEQAAP